MQATTQSFKSNVGAALADPNLQDSLAKLKVGFSERRRQAAERLPEFEALRDRARDIKNHTLAHLDFYLEEFERNAIRRGAVVHWAETAEEACAIIAEIATKNGVRTITKSKSMVSEEIALNDRRACLHQQQADGVIVEHLEHPAGGAVDRSKLTQVGRALAQLGIEHIAAYSPEARGRMERVFGTLQNRLPPELRRAGVTTKEAANRYLRETFVPAYNARFGKPAAEDGSAFVAYAGAELRDVLCVQEDRQVGRDNCVSWARKSLQIPAQRHRQHALPRVHHLAAVVEQLLEEHATVRVHRLGQPSEPGDARVVVGHQDRDRFRRRGHGAWIPVVV